MRIPIKIVITGLVPVTHTHGPPRQIPDLGVYGWPGQSPAMTN
jgi:hypothetical protein